MQLHAAHARVVGELPAEFMPRDLLRVRVYHQTDGVGGHVSRALPALAAAWLLGLRLVCEPALLFNGHMAQTDAHVGSRLLLGCGPDGELLSDSANRTIAWLRMASIAEAEGVEPERVINVTWATLSDVLHKRREELAGGDQRGAVVVFELPSLRQCGDGQRPPAGQVDQPPGVVLSHTSPFLPAAASMLRDGFNWGGLPERVAAPVWDSIGTAEHARCHRLAVHWRTARWSLNARGSTSMVALLNTVLSGAVGSVGVGDGCLRVALIAQFKEDPDGQEAAWAQMQATLTKLNGAGSPHAAALIRSDSSKSIFDADATVGNDDAEVFLRDLALMATAQLPSRGMRSGVPPNRSGSRPSPPSGVRCGSCERTLTRARNPV